MAKTAIILVLVAMVAYVNGGTFPVMDPMKQVSMMMEAMKTNQMTNTDGQNSQASFMTETGNGYQSLTMVSQQKNGGPLITDIKGNDNGNIWEKHVVVNNP